MRIDRIATAAVMAFTVLAACDTSRPVEKAAAGGCVACHGGADNQTGAPPRDTRGRLDGPMVGAHSRHLAAGVACESCHKVPATVSDEGHITGSDRVVFGAAARNEGAVPTYVPNADPASALGGTCSGTYCHGSTLNAGGTLHAPSWNGPASACDDCHGYPPPSHGPAAMNCFQCHPGSVKPDQTIKPGGQHADGKVQWDAVAACTACHGDASRVTSIGVDKAAPPVDTSGRTTGEKVGAHQAHLVDGRFAKAVACAECHVVPAGVAHATEPNTVVVFNGPVGTSGGATPTYAGGTCSGVYCHGGGPAPLPGGSNQAPSWTGGPDQAACGTCHAFVPPAPHPQQDRLGAAIVGPVQCSQCHPGTVNANGTMFVQNGLHVNGRVDTAVHGAGWLAPAGQPQPHGLAANYHDPAWPGGLSDCRACHGATLDGTATATSCNGCHAAAGEAAWKTSCTFCHGDANRGSFPAAPPVNTRGATAATERGVGAHQTHLLGKQPTGAISAGVACGDCHAGQPYGDIAHVDGTVAVALLAPGTGAPAGTFDAAAGTCASTYCHGGFRNGNAANAPSWTATSGQSACTACHQPQTGADAASYSDKHQVHVVFLNGDCTFCHGEGYAPAAAPPTAGKATHVNGTVELLSGTGWDPASRTCGSCHTTRSAPWY